MKFLNEIDGADKLKQDSNNRLVTDAEKSNWNSKASGDHNHSTLYEPKNTNIQSHISNKSNPHSVSKAQVGLGSVDNTSDLAKPISTATQTALNGKVDNSRVLTDVPLNAKFTDTNTTYSEITTAEIDAGTSSTGRTITGRRVKYILDKVSSMISVAIGALTKSNVGLGNVDNTSDASKPISTATQTALNGKVNNSQVLTNVPSGAKFTDTVTTINGKTGAVSKVDIVALGIPAQDTVYTHPTNAGNKHIPTGGTVGQVLKNTASGTATWQNEYSYTHPSTHSISEVTGLQGALDGKVDNSRVLTDVPANAKFTDTNTITTINGKTGVISKADVVALGIPAQDTVYTHPTTHPYSMITGTPTSLPANGGHALSATHLLGDDTRAVNSAPSVYMNGGARYASRAGWQTEFKTRTAIDSPPLSGTYVYLQTYTPWSDPSGGYPIQVVYGNGTPCWRVGVSTSAWSEWQSVNDNGNASTVNGFTILKSVPANANFSNTTYSVISTAEIDAGVSTTSRAISGARVKHILDKTKPVVSKVKPTNGSPIWYEEL